MEILQTTRLRLVPFAPEQVDDLHALWTEPSVRRYLWDDRVIDRAQAAAVVAASERDAATRGFGFWSLYPRADPAGLIGFCGFRAFEGSGEPELLYGILPRFQRRGLVVEAARAALRYGFSRGGMTTVIAATDAPNAPSVRVLLRLGMRFEARRDFRGLDTVFYRSTREEDRRVRRRPSYERERIMSEHTAVRARISGRVQGVFFRESTREAAMARGVAGWVRNRDDGDVELHAQGPREAVDALVDWAWQGPEGARVDDLSTETVTPEPELDQFEVRA